MGDPGTKADDYRREAKTCLEMAERAEKKDDILKLLDMAQRWLELADREDGSCEPPPAE